MSRNIIEELIDTRSSEYRGHEAGAHVRRRVQRRRVRNASLTGLGAVAAVGGVAAASTFALNVNRTFTPEAWAPAPNPYAPDIHGDGQARVPLPTPPQVHLPAVDTGVSNDPDVWACPAFPPAPTTHTGHAQVSLDAVAIGDQAQINWRPGSEEWESELPGAVSWFTVSSTTGAPTSVRVSESRLYFVSGGVVKEVWLSAMDEGESTMESRLQGDIRTIHTGRDLRHLGGDQLSFTDADLNWGTLPCGTNIHKGVYTTLQPGQEYQVYLEVRVVADEQSAAQLHLMDEGVDLDSVTGNNGTIVEVWTGGGLQTYEAIDVSFPASYLQDQFDEVLVSEPLTVRMPQEWRY